MGHRKGRGKEKRMNPVSDTNENAGPVQTAAVETTTTKQAKPKAARKGTKPGKNAKTAKKAAKGKKAKATEEAGKNAAPAKNATPAKKAAPGKKAAKPTERSNKKAEVIAMMQRAKGVTLAEIMEATGWQAHTIRGFVSILGSKGGYTIESSKNAAGERTYKIRK